MKNNNDFNKFATRHMGVNSMCLHDYKKAANKIVGFNAAGPITVPMNMTPNIIEERQMNAIAMDVFSRLMMDRIIFLGLPIDDMVANVMNAQLLWLESVDPQKPVYIYINCPGGSVYSGLGVYDVMKYVKPEIITINTGLAASMAAVLLCAGTKGKRSALKHSRTMIHQPSGSMGYYTQASDIEITAKEINKVKKELYEVISLHSGQSIKKVEKDSDRDFWMDAEEAKTYGLIDKVL
jgi:ATP-dependent Clp protease protease subunit